MRFQILTLFPELFEPFTRLGLVGRACTDGLLRIEPTQLREFAINAHGQIDDTPYGGGSGLVLRPETAVGAIESAKAKDPAARVVLFTPRGKPFKQETARRMAESGDSYIFLCTRYEGIDERVAEHWVDEEICVGDYILQGGEVAAMTVIEAVSRLVPGVLGNAESVEQESFTQSSLEYPQYTKPSEFRGHSVPEVLLSGHHAEIERWREQRSLEDTAARRPDLLAGMGLPRGEMSIALIHYPVLNKNGEVVVSSVTNLDLHDIARSSRTFGIESYYVVHPTKALRRLSEKICAHWETGYGATYNVNRSEALRAIKNVPDLDEVLSDIERRTGKLPKIITTSARPSPKNITFAAMRAELLRSEDPHLMLFGTGWGLVQEILDRSDYQLEPVCGFTEYNHLSVRGAAAIIFDRLFGKH